MSSPRRIHTNRSNALRSSGPKSASSKEKTRANALKHGQAARVCTPEEEFEALHERTAQLAGAFGGEGIREWLLEQIAAETLTLERCERHEILLRHLLADRFGTMWDEDRRAEVRDLAARLAGDPERIVARLRATPHGCDLIIERLEDLAIVLERRGGWDERHRHRAMDLLGLSIEVREGDPLGLATQAVEALEARKTEALDEIDAAGRRLAAEGMFVDVPRSLKLVRR